MTALTALALQLCLAAVAFAAPLADHQIKTLGMNPGQQYGTGGGIVGFIVLVLDIIIWSKFLSPLLAVCCDSSPSCSLPPRTGLLTSIYSRGPQVQPPAEPQDPVVCACLHLPGRRRSCVLGAFGPQKVERSAV